MEGEGTHAKEWPWCGRAVTGPPEAGGQREPYRPEGFGGVWASWERESRTDGSVGCGSSCGPDGVIRHWDALGPKRRVRAHGVRALAGCRIGQRLSEQLEQVDNAVCIGSVSASLAKRLTHVHVH